MRPRRIAGTPLRGGTYAGPGPLVPAWAGATWTGSSGLAASWTSVARTRHLLAGWPRPWSRLPAEASG